MKERFYLPPSYIAYLRQPLVHIDDYYVYEWLDGHTPFYIGMGKTYRAWAIHNVTAEETKHQAENFHIRIVQDCLSKRLAHSLERHQIKLRIRQGYKLTNIRIPR